MGLEVLDLSCDTSKGASDDADLATWLGVRLINLKRDAQTFYVFTRLGIDEILHLLFGDRDNLTLLFLAPFGFGHKLNRQEIRIRVLEFTDNLLLDLHEDEIANHGLGLVLQFFVPDDFLVFQAEIGGKAFLEKGIEEALNEMFAAYYSGTAQNTGAMLAARTAALSSIENRLVTSEEDSDIQDLIEAYDFEYLFYQELSDDTSWLPDFTRAQPFSNKLATPVWHC